MKTENGWRAELQNHNNLLQYPATWRDKYRTHIFQYKGHHAPLFKEPLIVENGEHFQRFG